MEKSFFGKAIGRPGGDQRDLQEVVDRVLCWGPSGIQLEADPRHQEILAADVEPEARPISTPGAGDRRRSDEASSDDQAALGED